MQPPFWMTVREDGVFVVDPDGFYPYYLKALGVEQVDQYWLEVAYQCMKLDVQAFACADGNPPTAPIAIKVLNRPGWALRNFPPGLGIAAATARRAPGVSDGHSARDKYMQIRGAQGQHPMLEKRQGEPLPAMDPDKLFGDA